MSSGHWWGPIAEQVPYENVVDSPLGNPPVLWDAPVDPGGGASPTTDADSGTVSDAGHQVTASWQEPSIHSSRSLVWRFRAYLHRVRAAPGTSLSEEGTPGRPAEMRRAATCVTEGRVMGGGCYTG